MEGDCTKLLLVTANVGSIFEDPEHMLKIWLKEFLTTVKDMEPGMVAIHCQEVGGKNYEASMQHVNQFVKAMLGSDELQKYDRARVFLDEDYTAADKFTALGNLYFIHECVEDVMIFDFIECKFMPVEGREVLSGNIENIQIKEKAKYPQNFFPDFKWSRKGFLRTRWSVNNCVFDLINIHLFHDASNIIAMQKSPSVYVENRYRALAHTLQRFDTDQFDTVPYFLFGDFNFRLDLKSLLKELTVKTQEQQTRGKKDQVSKLVYSDANNKVVLTLESKHFDHHDKHNEVFSNKNKLLNKYDIEMAAYKEKLFEFDIDFPPSYPFSEDVSDGLSYMKTRCPSWCDRILMSHTAKDILQIDERHKPKYQIIGKESCMGDHKPVYLSLLLKKGKGKRTPSYSSQSSSERRKLFSKTISINGETVEFEHDKFDIHDYAQFEKSEELMPEFRVSIKKKGSEGQDNAAEANHDSDDRKHPSFSDVARQVRLMETALLKWPRKLRTRHHSSSSEDNIDNETDDSVPTTAEVEKEEGNTTDVSDLSDTEDINIELHKDIDTNQNARKNGNEQVMKLDSNTDSILESSDLIKRSSLSKHEKQGTTEHVHDDNTETPANTAAATKPAASGATANSTQKGRELRCPCVVL